ncbi:ABC transporter permease [Kitasatospora azatica]|uniref:ABC transporter permease n=1 Tax=Kitasatospora azatica TaxID=58347 RepID=UPI00055E4BA2|nr:ABC transporter permease [Kitasatospora azatica]
MTTPAEPLARFRDLLAAEWTKLWSLRSTRWGYGLSALAVIGFNVNGAYADYTNWPGYSLEVRTQYFFPMWAMHDAFNRNSMMIMILAVGALGAMAVVTEYASGLIRTTFAAVPARRSVMAAKVLVVTAVMTAYGVLVSGCSFWLTQAVLSGRHVGLSIGYPGALRLVVASALVAPVCGLAGMAVGTLIRTSATSVVSVIVLLVVAPLSIPVNHYWQAVISHALPFNAWRRLLEGNPPPWFHEQYPTTGTGAWTVLAAWALVAVALTVLPVHRRDL